MSDIAVRGTFEPGLLRSWRFDGGFILGLGGLALLTGLALELSPALFPAILAADLWFLGYHHVTATFTRFAGDAENARRNRFLVLGLPVLVLFANLGVWSLGGLGLLFSIYFYWQAFHYARQSWGIAVAYGRKGGASDDEPAWALPAVIYLTPLWGIAHRLAERPDRFLGVEFFALPVAPLAADMLGLAVAAAVFLWLGCRVRAALRGEFALGQTAFVISHVAVFAAGYGLMSDLDSGWVAVNVWHNAQYLAFVWLANANRYRAGTDLRAPIMSRLSQPAALPVYVLVLLAVTFAAYGGLAAAMPALLVLGAPAAVIYQTINFHHYIVDAVVWRGRRKAV